MEILLIVLGAVCLLLGLCGCVLPALPGPPIAYVGLLLLHATDRVSFSTPELLVGLLLVILVQVFDYVFPMWGTKFFKGTKGGSRGSFIGTIAGLFFLPWGLILGPFIGALLGESFNGQPFKQAVRSAFGSLLGFLAGTFIKIFLCLYFVVQFVASLC